MQKVIISILHYNNSQDTKNCLDSLVSLDTKEIAIEAYVLDNGSKEPLEIDASFYSKIKLTVLKNKDNSGFTGGHNLIYEKVQDKEFDFLLLLNNDSLMDKECLLQLVVAMGNKKVGGAVPKIYFINSSM